MADVEFSKELRATETPIPGLVVYDLPVHGDNRGWFKENWQREKMLAIGLPDFGPVQNNISYNAKRGATRGIHAEPWDKYVSIANGKIFGAWVDLREGESFGKVFSIELDPSKAIFVPRGVANSYQALEDDTVYTYLVNDHWSADNKDYAFLNLADETAAIPWPIPLAEAELSDKDKAHPHLKDVSPITPRKTLILGANGQLGKALAKEFPNAELADRDTLDIAKPSIISARNWRQYDVIINAAAYTAVDLAETSEGRVDAWKINATALSYLSKIAEEFNVTLVHISSDYVFDGTQKIHDETESFSPLGVYGQSKAAGDIVVSSTKKHYLVRTSWVIGEGKNFVLTMKALAEKGVKPSVVNDQIGRLTFTEDLAKGIKHLIESKPSYGTYNLTNSGDSVSWADIASNIYTLLGKNQSDIEGVTTAEYNSRNETTSPRPPESTLNLNKIESTGFMPRNWKTALEEYLKNQ